MARNRAGGRRSARKPSTNVEEIVHELELIGRKRSRRKKAAAFGGAATAAALLVGSLAVVAIGNGGNSGLDGNNVDGPASALTGSPTSLPGAASSPGDTSGNPGTSPPDAGPPQSPLDGAGTPATGGSTSTSTALAPVALPNPGPAVSSRGSGTSFSIGVNRNDDGLDLGATVDPAPGPIGGTVVGTSIDVDNGDNDDGSGGGDNGDNDNGSGGDDGGGNGDGSGGGDNDNGSGGDDGGGNDDGSGGGDGGNDDGGNDDGSGGGNGNGAGTTALLSLNFAGNKVDVGGENGLLDVELDGQGTLASTLGGVTETTTEVLEAGLSGSALNPDTDRSVNVGIGDENLLGLDIDPDDTAGASSEGGSSEQAGNLLGLGGSLLDVDAGSLGASLGNDGLELETSPETEELIEIDLGDLF